MISYRNMGIGKMMTDYGNIDVGSLQAVDLVADLAGRQA